MNNAGESGVNQLIEGIGQLQVLVDIGDVSRISCNFADIGAAGLRNLASTTSNRCLEQVFLLLAEVDSFVAYIIQFIRDPYEVREFVCNTLNYKAQRVNSCNAAPPPQPPAYIVDSCNAAPTYIVY